MFGGIWGTIASGFFDNTSGVFYGGNGCWSYLGYQCLGLVCVIAWVSFMSSIIFYIMKRLGLFRVDMAIELIGLDIAEMGGLSEEVYEKIRRDYSSTLSPKTLSMHGKINLSNDHSNILVESLK